jgi:hypothetical protein
MFVNLLFRFIYLCLAISQTYLGTIIITIHLITSLYLIIKLNVIEEYFNTYIRLYNYLKDFYNNYNIISIIIFSIIIYNIEIIIIFIDLIILLYIIIKLNVIQEYFNTYIRLYNYLNDFLNNNIFNSYLFYCF